MMLPPHKFLQVIRPGLKLWTGCFIDTSKLLVTFGHVTSSFAVSFSISLLSPTRVTSGKFVCAAVCTSGVDTSFCCGAMPLTAAEKQEKYREKL
ncbi:unnamed protein product [Leptidea sinapis]|uniref:Uncharacterized protein n=1 Tax=Leptidea sinapis TaxID=189913 RepID=A0A5E4QNT0_9NEOP|nr:unnamed protein product [Leptidea sinapis]